LRALTRAAIADLITYHDAPAVKADLLETAMEIVL
jgi:hypothetical protein